MTDRVMRIEHNGQELWGRIHTVEKAFLGADPDRGLWTSKLDLRDGSLWISIGGYNYGTTDQTSSAFAMEQIKKWAWVVGVSDWSEIKGKQVIALFDKPGMFEGKIVGLAHLTEDRTYIPEFHLDMFKAGQLA